jgi:hypothetical protein
MREHIGLFIWVWILGANSALLLISHFFGRSQPVGPYAGRKVQLPETPQTVLIIEEERL